MPALHGAMTFSERPLYRLYFLACTNSAMPFSFCGVSMHMHFLQTAPARPCKQHMQQAVTP